MTLSIFSLYESTKRRNQWLVRSVVLLGAILLLFMTATNVFAADGTLTVHVTPATTPILSGQNAIFDIALECSVANAGDNCEGSKIIIPTPANALEGVLPTLPDGLTAVRLANGDIEITVGASYVGSVVFPVVFPTANGTTPDGTAVTLEASVTAGDGVTVNSVPTPQTIIVNSDASIDISKSVSPDPKVGSNITYGLQVCYAGQSDTTAGVEPGTWFVENVSITDLLPAGAILIGTSVPATQTDVGGRIQLVWDNVLIGEDGCASPVSVTVQYPAGTENTNVINEASVVSDRVNDPANGTVSDSVDLKHWVAADSGGTGYVYKRLNPRNPELVPDTRERSPGETASWSVEYQNTGSTDTHFVIEDRFEEYLDFFSLTVLQFGTITNLTLEYTLDDPSVTPAAWVTIAFDSYTKYDPEIPDGVLGFRVTGDMEPNARLLFFLAAEVAADIPENIATQVNCATFTATDASGTIMDETNCEPIDIVPLTAIPEIYKNGVDIDPGTGDVTLINAAAPPGGEITFEIEIVNSRFATGDLVPVVTELLPPELAYVPDSTTGGLIDGNAPIVTVIDDYNGTGRQLVRWEWPAGSILESTGNENSLESTKLYFVAAVVDGTAVGSYNNTASVTNNDIDDFTNQPTRTRCANLNTDETDSSDLDGDGITTEPVCTGNEGFDVLEAMGATATKSSRGVDDPDWILDPDTGTVWPGEDFQFKIEWQNTGNLDIGGLVIYDILPYSGDGFVSDLLSGPRDTEWDPTFVSLSVTGIAGATIEYSTSTNPCRIEVYPTGPADCVNDWTTTLPADPADVMSFRIVYPSTVTFAPSDTVTITVNMQAPAPDPIPFGGIVWNSLAWDAGADGELDYNEPPRAGVAFVTPDFGDAPSTYNTDRVNDGPLHYLIGYDGTATTADLMIGTTVDAEGVGTPSAAADSDDDDGVSFTYSLGVLTATITGTNDTGVTAYLCGWVDVGADGTVVDGSFDSVEENCVTVDPGATFSETMTWSVSTITTTDTFARFRLSTDATAAGSPVGAAPDGEVEDYEVNIDPTAVTIGKVELQAVSVADFLAGLDVDRMSTPELEALLEAWDVDGAGADRQALLDALRAYLDPDGDGRVALLKWDTLEERGTIGFYVKRAADNDNWVLVNNDMLPGLINAPMGGEYVLVDPAARSGEMYQYLLIEQEADGNTRQYGPFTVEMP